MMTRRQLVRSAISLTAIAVGSKPNFLFAKDLSGGASPPPVRIPPDFIGLGYEMSSVAKSGLLSAGNAPYVHLLKNLGSEGVIRVGGIVVDFTRYSAHDAAVALPKDTVINDTSLHQFRGFLDAAGWSTIWSVNFASGTLEEAIQEVKAVSQILGPRLYAIELGNEVENYSRGAHPLRTPPYAYETYRAEYSQWRAAILAAVPAIRFAAPDTAASVEWVERMASDAHHDVQLLTTHYYRGDQKQGTQSQLLNPDPDLIDKLKRLRTASLKSGIPWRMCETNSFFGGGRPGLSDTLAGALWTLDFMLLLAHYGCAGVNMETGVNQLGFISSYSPIQDDSAGHNSAGAPYYGMLAFAAATAHAREVVAIDLPANPDLSAYALGTAGSVESLVLIDKSADRDVPFPLDHIRLRRPGILSLTGPSLDSKTGITFGGASVQPDGRWSGSPKSIANQNLIVPAASAAILRST